MFNYEVIENVINGNITKKAAKIKLRCSIRTIDRYMSSKSENVLKKFLNNSFTLNNNIILKMGMLLTKYIGRCERTISEKINKYGVKDINNLIKKVV